MFLEEEGSPNGMLRNSSDGWINYVIEELTPSSLTVTYIQ